MPNVIRRLLDGIRGRLQSESKEESRPKWNDRTEKAELSLSYKGLSLKAAYQIPSDDDVEADLQPVTRARAAGARNSPPAEQQDLSADEDAIVLFFKNFLRVTEQRVFDVLATLRNDLERLRAEVTVPDVDRAFARLEAELRRLKLEWTGRMIQSNKDRLEAWRNLRHFRATHRIDRAATYSDAFYFDFMLLTALVVLETAGNAIFYRVGNEYGYVGGLANAFLISVVNVFLAFFVLGFLSLRHLHVRRAPLKLAAIFGVLSSIAGIGVLNLAAAHYRDMLSAVPQAELIDAVGAVFSKGFALTTLPALALLLFGYSLAAFAAYKGYYFDDPFPGFGTVTRKYEDAKAVQAATEMDFRAALNDAAKRHAAAVELEVDAFRWGVRDSQTIIALFDQIRLYFPDYQRNVIQRKCDATLRLYREENARVRTSAAPAAFRQYPVVFLDYTPPDLPAPLRDLQGQIAELRTADKLYAQLQKEFLDRVESFYGQIEAELEQIEKLAGARLDRQEPPP